MLAYPRKMAVPVVLAILLQLFSPISSFQHSFTSYKTLQRPDVSKYSRYEIPQIMRPFYSRKAQNLLTMTVSQKAEQTQIEAVRSSDVNLIKKYEE